MGWKPVELSEAILLYRDSRQIIEITRELAAQDDELDWAREDLAEAAWDLKLAVTDDDQRRMNMYGDECRRLLMVVRLRARQLRENGE